MPLVSRHLQTIRHGIAALVLCGLCLTAFGAQAQGVGSVTGTIYNQETGEKLDYANVVLVRNADGAQWGGMSLGGGKFFLNGIPTGEYTLKVLYLGYKQVNQPVTVTAGQTESFDFPLEVTIVKEFDVIGITGAAVMVNVKETETVYKLGSENLTDYAVDSVEEAVSRQAGIVARGGELHVRGGRSGELSFRVDGVAVDNPLGGAAVSVSSFAVSGVETTTGGQDPEFGNALSGVVNVRTREGDPDDFEVNVRYMTDDFGRQDRTFTNFDRFEFGLGGPTGIPRLTWWAAGDLRFTDNENFSSADRPETKVELFGAELFKYRRRQTNEVQGQVKFAYAFDRENNKKITAEYIANYNRWESYMPNWDVQGYTRQIVRMPVLEQDGGRLKFTGAYRSFFYGPWVNDLNNLATTRAVVVDTGQGVRSQPMPVMVIRDVRGTPYLAIAQPAFVGARYPDSLFSTVAADSSYVPINSANNGPQFEQFRNTVKFNWRHTLTEETFYTLKVARSEFDYHQSVGDDKLPQQFLHGGVLAPAPVGGTTRQYNPAADYYTDPDNAVFITDASEWPGYTDRNSKQYSVNFDITSNRYEGHKLKSGVRLVYNDLQQLRLNNPGLVTFNRFDGSVQRGTSRNIFHTYNPEASFYLQDRWEFEGMVLSGGFRWDMFSPGSAAAIEVDSEELNQSVFKYKHQISPRLGFAFPITDRDGFNFSYGRFVQFPARGVLFASQNPVGADATLGNPNLEAELTIQYQAGISHQFNDYLAATFAVYNRDIYGLISATPVTDESTGNVLSRYINKAYGNARGVEFTVKRREHNRWAFEIAYTYAFADGVASDQEFGANPNGLEFLPNQELPLDWDQRHGVATSLRIREPGKWAASLTFDYGSGFPWTPGFRFERKVDPLDENSERLPQTYDLRLQAEREVNFYGQKLTLYLQGLNLLNEDSVGNISPGIAPGPILAFNAGVSYLTETGKYGGAYLQDIDGDNINDFVPLNDPRVFEQHRLFRVGVGWKF